MGYSSQVRIIFYARNPEHYPAIKLFVEENFPDEGGMFDKTEHPEKLMLEYRAEDVKWYDGYTSVREVHEFLTKFGELFDSEDSELEGAYEYARIGEDTNDLEHEGSPSSDWFLGISREFYIA
jgi:hypothetical protein